MVFNKRGGMRWTERQNLSLGLLSRNLFVQVTEVVRQTRNARRDVVLLREDHD